MSKTYAQVLSPLPNPTQMVTPNPTQMLMPEVSSYKGEIAIRFSREQVDSLASPFQYALIGKFSQGRPKLDAVKRFLEVQNYDDKYKVGVLDSKHILINFSGEKDFIRLYSRNQWFVTSKSMRIFKWTPDFHVDVESSLVPVWITLPKLPAHLMKLEPLRGIVSSFGKLLRPDASTASFNRPSTARVQVEIDLLRPLPKRLWIQQADSSGFWQYVELEASLPKYCIYCSHIGHNDLECRIKNPVHEPNEQIHRGNDGLRQGNEGPPPQIWRPKLSIPQSSPQHLEKAYAPTMPPFCPQHTNIQQMAESSGIENNNQKATRSDVHYSTPQSQQAGNINMDTNNPMELPLIGSGVHVRTPITMDIGNSSSKHIQAGKESSKPSKSKEEYLISVDTTPKHKNSTPEMIIHAASSSSLKANQAANDNGKMNSNKADGKIDMTVGQKQNDKALIADQVGNMKNADTMKETLIEKEQAGISTKNSYAMLVDLDAEIDTQNGGNINVGGSWTHSLSWADKVEDQVTKNASKEKVQEASKHGDITKHSAVDPPLLEQPSKSNSKPRNASQTEKRKKYTIGRLPKVDPAWYGLPRNQDLESEDRALDLGPRRSNRSRTYNKRYSNDYISKW